MNSLLSIQKPSSDQQENTQASFINIVEIFGPTIQGEGALIGMPTVFVRSGGCDYRCSWCDTDYAVLPRFENNWHSMDSHSIFNEIERLSKGYPLWVTLSGGNPAMQDFSKLIKQGHDKGYQFSMETQASIAKPWFSLLDQLTLSPKPPSSGMSFKQRGLERCLQACQTLGNQQVEVSLKFVVADHNDVVWAKGIADQYPDIECFIQPCNTDASLEKNTMGAIGSKDNQDQQRLLWLIDATQSLHWYQVRVLPQLHRWLWGDKAGV